MQVITDIIFLVVLYIYIFKFNNHLICIRHRVLSPPSPRVLSPFRGGGIAYLNDPDSYAGWSFCTPVRATQARQVEG